jgi:hypothetical protein
VNAEIYGDCRTSLMDRCWVADALHILSLASKGHTTEEVEVAAEVLKI